MAIEQPVSGCGQRDAVLHYVRTAIGHAPDMSGLGLGLAATVHHAQAGDGAATVIGVKDVVAEGGVTHLPVHQKLSDAALVRRHREQSCGRRIEMPRIEFEAHRASGDSVSTSPRFTMIAKSASSRAPDGTTPQRPACLRRTVQLPKQAFKKAAVRIAIRHGTIKLDEVLDAGVEEPEVGGSGSILCTRPTAT